MAEPRTHNGAAGVVFAVGRVTTSGVTLLGTPVAPILEPTAIFLAPAVAMACLLMSTVGLDAWCEMRREEKASET